ncbi:GlxA family transcriptional regulator [Vibrio rhodolitus]|uniref:GlxA family transcriptional regulator n=1 Tax=Vibrio rhodolitus TaxID=2231649 RepID=UPI001FC98458|nr:helix-turn-helix domain-containing protein [Vibrio rhodolitus]
MDNKEINVVILVTDNALNSAVSGVADILSIANHLMVKPLFRIKTLASQNLTSLDTPDLLFLPPGKMGTVTHYDGDTLQALKMWHTNGTTLAANCASVFWLAHAGLLDQRAVTTHWKLCEQLAQEFPLISEVKRHEMVVDEGSIITGSGLFAFQDLTLHVIARYAGFELAKEVADVCLLDFSGRLQAHYERFVPDFSHGNPLVLKAQHYCEQTPLGEQNNQAMAEVCCVSEKTLTRAFKKVLNLTPQQYRLNYKMDLAKREMNINKRTVEQVAYQLGYNDVSNFTRVFKKVVGITPTHYRSRFISE